MEAPWDRSARSPNRAIEVRVVQGLKHGFPEVTRIFIEAETLTKKSERAKGLDPDQTDRRS